MSNKILFTVIFFAAIIKLIAIYFTNFNLFGDEAQYWIWSQNLDLGYYSKPPLLAWIISLFCLFFGNSFEVLKIIPFVFYFFTAYVIYLLSLELYKDKIFATISAISFYLLPIVSVSSFLLSTDVVLVFFWSLSLLILLKIRKNPKIINFLLLGIFLGMSFLAKYAAVYFLISLFLIMFVDKKIKESFFKNKYYFIIFIASNFLVLLPNILWNLNNNWITLNHTSDNAGLERINFNFFQGIEFFITQGIMIGPILFVVFFFFIKKIKFNFQTNFLLAFSLPIFLIIFFESMLVRANANWAAVGLISIFVFILQHLYFHSKKTLIFNNVLNFIFCCVFYIFIAVSAPYKIFDRISGISEFTYQLKKNYLSNYNYLIVEDRLLYSNLRYELKNTNAKILMPYDPHKKIKNHFHLSNPLLINFKKNFIFIGNPLSLEYLIEKKRVTKIESKKVIFKKIPLEIYEVNF